MTTGRSTAEAAPDELYRFFLLAAALMLCVAPLLLTSRTELLLHFVATLAALASLAVH